MLVIRVFMAGVYIIVSCHISPERIPFPICDRMIKVIHMTVSGYHSAVRLIPPVSSIILICVVKRIVMYDLIRGCVSAAIVTCRCAVMFGVPIYILSTEIVCVKADLSVLVCPHVCAVRLLEPVLRISVMGVI